MFTQLSVILTLSSISSCLLFWSGNYTLMDENSEFVVFNMVNEWSDILINRPNCLFATKVNENSDACWTLLWAKLECSKATSTGSNFPTFSPSLSWSTSFLYFLIISLSQEIIILIHSLFLFLKHSYFWLYSRKFAQEDCLL